MTSTEPRESNGTNGDRQGIQSVETAMRVLLALESGGGALSLSAIAQASGMQPSKVHRYLVSLGRIGLTSQDAASGLYDFGATMRRMGAEALRRTNEVAVAGGHAMRLRDRTGHSVNLAVWGDRGPIVVSWAYGTRPLPLTVRVGATLPLVTSSVGRVFLAHLPESLTDEVLRDELRGKETDWPAERLAATREQVRDKGYAETRGSVIPGIISIAAPVFAAGDPLPLAISVVLPESLGTPDHVAEVTRELRTTVTEASHELGHLT
ncbi:MULTISPECIES: IclR family transcriptional regulator [unclassified Streptomyces]|uniref:IclR family transcriptional regulator n=1 Tax=unclassified Streptomyces TaxID=2593676 RepID=UPI002E75C087|nr:MULTISPECIES: IclR family transcriptional regulator [unclassified Streptomyces]MEE1759819.1 IclR family transcriptional regulator [Streptomyces sp. SP18BB07]MEE1830152.1 IclR family transcriptional regulator [Streptomyces sp. SP17KL33]